MCFHPIKIRNPSLYFNPKIDKPYIEVPCGHCEQCAKNRVSDLVVRSYYEWCNCVKNGGFAYFDTLTYNNKCVPSFLGEMCFSRKDITNFLKRLRISLTREGYQLCDESKKPLLRYLLVTEYGEDEKRSMRPHYHVIWFCNVPGLTLFHLYHSVRKNWKWGFNDHIDKVLSHVINRLDGIKYVCKYLTKTTDYQTRVQRLLNKYKDDNEKITDILNYIKNFKPFYRSSLGYGSQILDVKYEDLVSYGVPLYSASGPEFYPIPRYIKYKIHYDKVPHPTKDKASLLKRNEAGISFMINHLDEVIDAKTLFYQNIVDNASAYDNSINYKSFINDLLDKRSLRDFVIYKCVYKGHLFSDVSFNEYHKYYEDWLRYPRTGLSPCKTQSMLNHYLLDHNHAIIQDTARLEWFGFDEIDDTLDFLVQLKQKCDETTQISKHLESDKISEICHRFGLVH